MKCIILERPHAQSPLKEMVSMVPYFHLVSYCSSVFDAYEILRREKIDIVFVDTVLSKVSGVDFIKSLEHKPLFVFVSDKPELAVEGYNLNALDFLLKPLTFDRFLKTANKAYECSAPEVKRTEFVPEPEHQELGHKTILVKTDYKTILIKVNNILYIEGLKDYIKIYTKENNKPVITLNSLKRLQQNLPSEKFSRVHKSYIVGLDHINAINKTQVMIKDKFIPIGESYRSIFSQKMEELRV
ncbi:LytTR family DNA-binding domain-containing protein [Draconibacterium sp. IB214405]|uniref:LytR/AlgR family response regulator transcription factor n=1 Tax=Draconibacterium sp. IB214405 TaxID=3097352 RepID=UPI002A1434B0|nr:LytTR family DNA-binding domain-containing protein [Draconibacterium sp. IB214405]MDX8339800.1 LytTR family DNA-binding domain-containing protein [Draconibacterium sp. IB214405]